MMPWSDQHPDKLQNIAIFETQKTKDLRGLQGIKDSWGHYVDTKCMFCVVGKNGWSGYCNAKKPAKSR